ncbi:MAG: hypothetical protein ACRET2_16505 [Steroidobacteraceae bacterium]
MIRTQQELRDYIRTEARKTAMDAVREDDRSTSRKQQLYDRISQHTGAFEHGEMSLAEMASSAAKKLGIELDSGADPVAALEGYLKGRTHTESGASGMDASPDSFVGRYLNGGK